MSIQSNNSNPLTDHDQQFTPVEYGGLQVAYDHFNAELFDGVLPDVFITYQRKANSRGYFSPERFSARAGSFGRDEVGLNPDTFIGRSDEEICSTLVHEQCHVWQEHHGTRPSRGYHNKEWGATMKSVGLHPSTTGVPGGKETGARVTHYIIPCGPFARSFTRLAATGWRLNLQSTPRDASPGGKSSKTKFTCPQCGQNAWGKPELLIACLACDAVMRGMA